MRYMAVALFLSACVFPGAAVQRQTVTYFADTAFSLQAELFIPDTGVNHPVLVCIHEGGFRRYDRHCHTGHGIYFSRRGWAVFSIDYRLVQQGGRYPGTLNDCVEALHWLAAHGDSLDIDTGAVVVMGASAGAYLATMIGVLDGLPGGIRRGHGSPQRSFSLVGVISILGLYDWTQTQWSGEGFIRGNQRSEASPIQYCAYAKAPFLLLAGGRDRLFDKNQALSFARCVQRKGGNATVIVHPKQPHDGICNFDGRVMKWALPIIETFLARVGNTTEEERD